MPDAELVPLEPIQSCILVLRGVRVILDADLALLYGVPTKRLNEQVKRNVGKFPEDFCFQLSREEARDLAALRSQNATLNQGENLRSQFATSSQGGTAVGAPCPMPSPSMAPSRRQTCSTAWRRRR
jgi:hypothetical protein